MHLVTIAAENGALPHGKVGGVADVVRELPLAMAELGWTSTVLSPGYGVLANAPGAVRQKGLQVPFRGSRLRVRVYSVATAASPIRHVVFEHAGFSPQGPGKIYCHDHSDTPFATDANKFALFCAAAACYVAAMREAPSVIHLHDWHAALYVVLREFDPRFAALKRIRTVYTIHNLAMQGIRPLGGHESALESWFPRLRYRPDAVLDPRYADCINPMAAAIRLADFVNTVSPTYAREIRKPNDPARGFRGGEGLEEDLIRTYKAGRQVGILNGCLYARRRRRPGWGSLVSAMQSELSTWARQRGPHRDIHELALQRVNGLPKRRPRHVLSSIGRLSEQKAALFLQQSGRAGSALEEIVDGIGRGGVLIMIGSGEAEFAQRIMQLAARKKRLIFLCGYSESAADLLYRAGDLFLMPSSFEPCGISQMLAMREGQPCVVHAVGGLRDTVKNGENGFTFRGRSRRGQATRFVETVRHALRLKEDRPDDWHEIRKRAAAARFEWALAAQQYSTRVYEHPAG